MENKNIMSRPAQEINTDTSSVDLQAGDSRMEQAQHRFSCALARLDAVLAVKMAKPSVTASEDSRLIEVLREEIDDLRRHNAVMSEANTSALTQIELTIGRLKGVVDVAP